jgi:hypothetical protein
MPQAQHL